PAPSLERPASLPQDFRRGLLDHQQHVDVRIARLGRSPGRRPVQHQRHQVVPQGLREPAGQGRDVRTCPKLRHPRTLLPRQSLRNPPPPPPPLLQPPPRPEFIRAPQIMPLTNPPRVLRPISSRTSSRMTNPHGNPPPPLLPLASRLADGGGAPLSSN